MMYAKNGRKAFKKGVKRIAKDCGLKKKEVIAGIKAHDRYMRETAWVDKMQEEYPALN